MVNRRDSRRVMVGSVAVGGGAPVSVQTMLNCPPENIPANIAAAQAACASGCDILRIAVPRAENAALIYEIKNNCTAAVVADIHFDYKIALECVAAGVDKIRINPGNIGDDEHVKAVALACANKDVPIRVGVNAGSLEKSVLAKYGGITAQAMADSAMYHVGLLRKFDFEDIIISLKASDTPLTVEAYELCAEQCDYPLHLGVTEAGTLQSGLIKSSAAMGYLLMRGIGDTLRFSLTDNPVREVEAGISLLKSLGMRSGGPVLKSCPTCGRCKIKLIELAAEVERRLVGCKKDITVAAMGCVVNGPGEAGEADIGFFGGDGCGVIIKNGERLRTVPEDKLVDELMIEINRF